MEEKSTKIDEILDKSFEVSKFSSFEKFLKLPKTKKLDTYFLDFQPKKTTKAGKTKNEPYVMSTEDKLHGIEKLLENIKQEVPDAEITQSYKGKEEGLTYIVFPIDCTDISVVENFKTEKNEPIYFIKNNNIECLNELGKSSFSKLDGVEKRNHIKNFDNYVKNITNTALELINEKKAEVSFNPEKETEAITDSIVTEKEEKKETKNSFEEDQKNIDEIAALIFADEEEKVQEPEEANIEEKVQEPEEANIEENVLEPEEEIKEEGIKQEEKEEDTAIEKIKKDIEQTDIENETSIENKRNELVKEVFKKMAIYKDAKKKYEEKEITYQEKKAQIDALISKDIVDEKE